MRKDLKIIAFYLPQFHTIPENDQAHGEGFTEWTNTRKAKPLFEGHIQPKIPLGENYYCLLDDGVMKGQAELAKKYGIYGFCYYHYWFGNGKKLLEKPIEMMLNDKSIDIPFCLCWANESWRKKWDDEKDEVIVEQTHDDKDDLDKHVDYLCDFFADERYIKIDNKPVFIIYRPEIIPKLRKFIKKFRSKIMEHGYPGVVLMAQYPKFYYEGLSLDLFDNYIQFQPLFVQTYDINKNRTNLQRKIIRIMIALGLRDFGKKVRELMKRSNTEKTLEIRSYDEDWEKILNYDVNDKRLIPGAFPDWDNTPRSKTGIVYKGSTPEKFEENMRALINKVEKEYYTDLIFVNAWNEWAEGAILEPDSHNGYSYLEALREAINA